jgi:hypothetical protein
MQVRLPPKSDSEHKGSGAPAGRPADGPPKGRDLVDEEGGFEESGATTAYRTISRDSENAPGSRDSGLVPSLRRPACSQEYRVSDVSDKNPGHASHFVGIVGNAVL